MTSVDRGRDDKSNPLAQPSPIRFLVLTAPTLAALKWRTKRHRKAGWIVKEIHRTAHGYRARLTR